MTYKQAKVILAYAENDMNAFITSEKIYNTYRNITYHLDTITKQTGRDPRKFYDLCYLVGIAAQVMEGRKYVGYR